MPLSISLRRRNADQSSGNVQPAAVSGTVVLVPTGDRQLTRPAMPAGVQCRVAASRGHPKLKTLKRTFGDDLITVDRDVDVAPGALAAEGLARAEGELVCWSEDPARVTVDLLDAARDRLAGDADVVLFQDARARGERAAGETDAWTLAASAVVAGHVRLPVVARRAALTAIGAPSAESGEDYSYEWAIRAVRAGLRVAVVPHDDAGAAIADTADVEGVAGLMRTTLGYLPIEWAERLASYRLGAEASALAHVTELRRVMSAYNTDMTTLQWLRSKRQSKLHGRTVSVMEQLGLFGQQPYRRVTTLTYKLSRHRRGLETFQDIEQLAQSVDPLFKELDEPTVHTFDGTRLWIDGDWRERQLARSREVLAEAAEQRRGDVCVVVGNGPSLNKSNLDLLAGVDTFVSNYAVLSPQLARHASVLAVTNHLVADQAPHLFNAARTPLKVFPYWLRYCIHEDPQTVFLNAEGGAPFFSTDIIDRISWHSTVTHFHLQLAYHLGYSRVLMIGFDHSYDQKATAKEGDVLYCESNDANHFDARYFKGKKWQAADTGRMGQVYELAKAAFEADGRVVKNCTVGGHLEVFERSSLEAELK